MTAQGLHAGPALNLNRNVTTVQSLNCPRAHRSGQHQFRRQPAFTSGNGSSRCRAKGTLTVAAAEAASAISTSDSKDVSRLIMALHQAAADRTISPKNVCGAMTQIEKKKLSPDGWEQILGGQKSPGRRWQLVFATGTKQVQEALKTGKGGGTYFPINAVQGWDTETHKIENGIYLGHILSFAFIGSWQMSKRKMDFTFDRVNIKLGPWKFGIPFPEKMLGKKEFKSGPFYLFCYVDERVVVARGRGGGLALWARTSPAWEAQAGIAQA